MHCKAVSCTLRSISICVDDCACRDRSRSPVERGHAKKPKVDFKDQNRLFISNLPFDLKWTDVKDLVKEKGMSVKRT